MFVTLAVFKPLRSNEVIDLQAVNIRFIFVTSDVLRFSRLLMVVRPDQKSKKLSRVVPV